MKNYIVGRSVCYESLTKFENVENNFIADMNIFIWYKCIKACTGMTNFKFGLNTSERGKKNGRWKGTQIPL